jgi:hypothetical protein
MRQLLLMTVGAVGQPNPGQRIVGSALTRPGLRVSSLGIRHVSFLGTSASVAAAVASGAGRTAVRTFGSPFEIQQRGQPRINRLNDAVALYAVSVYPASRAEACALGVAQWLQRKIEVDLLPGDSGQIDPAVGRGE